MSKYLILLLVCAIYACAPKEKKQQVPTQPPNVVLIFTDDQGYQDVGVFGSPDIETPNLDQMAKEGVQLTSYYSAQAVCSASRAGILTGCYPNRIGIHNALGPGNTHGISEKETTMAEMLRGSGI